MEHYYYIIPKYAYIVIHTLPIIKYDVLEYRLHVVVCY